MVESEILINLAFVGGAVGAMVGPYVTLTGLEYRRARKNEIRYEQTHGSRELKRIRDNHGPSGWSKLRIRRWERYNNMLGAWLDAYKERQEVWANDNC